MSAKDSNTIPKYLSNFLALNEKTSKYNTGKKTSVRLMMFEDNMTRKAFRDEKDGQHHQNSVSCDCVM